jgi:hypothetical protein
MTQQQGEATAGRLHASPFGCQALVDGGQDPPTVNTC